MYTINYNYKVGDYVFIVRGKTIAKCKVIRIALEVDPDGTDAILEKKRYHLQVIGENNIGIVDEDVIFTTSDMAVEHMFDPTIIAPELNTYSISYTYLPRAIVWSFDAQIPLESTVTQICFEIYQNNSNIIYNILPLNETYRVLQRADYEVFDTITDVVNYMRFLYDQALSPTPTLSVTPTETPPPTSSNTPTISPSPSISSSVTPTPTLTQTPTSSPVWD